MYIIDSTYSNGKAGYAADTCESMYGSIKHYAEQHNDRQLAAHANLLQHITLLYRLKKEDTNNNYAKQEEITEHFIESLAEKHSKYLYPYALMLYARFLDFYGNYTSGFEYKLKAHELYKDQTLSEFPDKYSFTNSLGGSYYKFQDYHSCIKCMQAIVDGRLLDNTYYTSLNTYALCYRNMRIWDSAEYYFDRLYREAAENNNQEWQLIAKLNLAHTYYRSGRSAKAYQYFTETYEYAHQHGYTYGITESVSRLSKIAYDSAQYNKAKALALEGLSAHNDNSWIYLYYSDAQRLYEVLADVYEHEANYELAYLYIDSLLMVVDSTSTNRLVNLSTAIQAKSQLLQDKYLREKETATLAVQKHRQLLIISIIIVSLLLVISVLLINRQRLKHKKTAAEKQAAETQLTAAEKELGSYTKRLQEKKQLIEQFSAQIEEYKAATNEQAQHEILLQLQRSTILTDEDWIEFKNLFEQVHSGFLRKLKEKVPELTPGETRFIVLCKLDLTTKEMAGILGVGDSTIRKYRHQVRNKLGLPEDGNINEAVDII